ncbi:DUF2171 domain-containing protein [Sphingomonas astaxanthinifaciens]|uniref:DUF2171 domain-containing protein n=1 Tax=Sphingomonas astaxanthinifaciens DSM 22298 TaxID=1123267 RepID=A0ABQ5Z7W6_9SPHN|nr:DUF2171 domain-containing protein [Sphingomonas astaxanthinifaciens]GLR48090.1 hypothetical protein GCM10007925_18030 [Sphingomonas astaxanthinifaciens DSM 22298]
MAYDRYDSRDENRGYRSDRQRNYGSDREDRGFFQRAADEVSSWFGDDSSGGRRDDDRYSRSDRMSGLEGRSDRDRGGYTAGQGGWGSSSSQSQSYAPRAYDEDENRQSFGRDEGRYGRSDRSAFFSGDRSASYGRDERSSRDSDSYGSSFGRSDTGRQNMDRGYQSQGSDRYQPMTGDYGRGSGLGSQDYGQQQYGRQDRLQDQDRDMGSQAYGRSQFGGRDSFGSGQQSRFGGQSQQSGYSRSPHDDHYSSWRQRQIEDLDRDYDEYRREHQSRFENEFSSFRTQRQTKRQLLGQIREHAEVVDESGERIGTVDKVRGDKVILTKNDPEANGVHRSFTCSLLDRIEDGKVYLTGKKDSIRSRLEEERDEGQSGGMLGGLFGSDRERDEDRRSSMSRTDEGPHMLDKSFSGTYDDGGNTASTTPLGSTTSATPTTGSTGNKK